MRRNPFVQGLCACVVALAAGSPLQGASVDLNSTLTAVGVGNQDNNVIDFTLEVEGDVFVEKVTMFGNDTWIFESLAGVWSQGTAVDWDVSVAPGAVHLVAIDGEGAFDPEPLRLRVNMSTWGDDSQLEQISYTANGYAVANPTAEQIIGGTAGYFSTSGRVGGEPIGGIIPEPASAAMAGAGLLVILLRSRTRSC